MDEERRCLFIQQKRNLLSGRRDRGDSLDNFTPDTKVEDHKDARYKACASLAQIVDFNVRSANQPHAIVASDPENLDPTRNRQMGENLEQVMTNLRRQNGHDNDKMLQRDEKLSVLGHFSPRNLEMPGFACPQKTPTLEATEGGGIVLCDKAKSESFVPKELLNRIRTDNILHLSKEANGTEIHDPKKCESCREKEEQIAHYEFVKHQKTRLESAILDRHIDDAIHTTDTVLMIGEIARTLPKPSDNRDLVWEKLLRIDQGHTERQ